MSHAEASPETGITELLGRHRRGDREALGELMPRVYDELRRIARRQVRRGARDGTIDTTALVHEAFVKLSEAERPEWQDRCHFMAVAATAMRQVLVDYARRRNARKRGSGAPHVSLDSTQIGVDEQADLLLAVDGALTRLAELSPRLGRVVECKFFGGMTTEETAEVLAVNERTVRRDWVKARAWLHRELGA